MKAVWSFWTKPFREHYRHVWASPLHHLLAWVLSVETVGMHYSDTVLFTDEEGARLLVDRLRLGFRSVSTELDNLRDVDADWWVLGKLWTYRCQTEPFIHFDNDVFLWRRLPATLETASVLAQNPESFSLTDESWYRPMRYEQAVLDTSGWLPDEWLWATSGGRGRAVSCGILGGRAWDFLAYYADLGIRAIRHQSNQAAWARIGNPIWDNILFEQYLLAACLDFHRQSAASKYRGIRAAFLFESSEQAFNEQAAKLAGYTHLIGGAKTNSAILRRLAGRVKRDYPSHYERCLRLAGSGLAERAFL